MRDRGQAVICRACQSGRTRLSLDLPAPGLTSLAEAVDLETKVYQCEACSHFSSPTIPDASSYYLEAYDTVDGNDDDLVGYDEENQPIYRVQRQCEALFHLLELPESGRMLDYGCGHGIILSRFLENRPRWQACGYEVSPRYAGENISIGVLPEGPFDLITSYYVFEHLEDPRKQVSELADLLSNNGRLFLALPDALSNPADFLNVDHLSHFSMNSLDAMLRDAGLFPTTSNSTLLPGTLLIVAGKDPKRAMPPPQPLEDTPDPGVYWHEARESLRNFLDDEDIPPRSIAIYGAGVFGTALLLQSELPEHSFACFVDRNPRKQGMSFNNLLVYDLDEIPETVTTVLIGVKPDEAGPVSELGPIGSRRCFLLPPWRVPCTA